MSSKTVELSGNSGELTVEEMAREVILHYYVKGMARALLDTMGAEYITAKYEQMKGERG